ncbi:hypothetical protein [Planococcus rifietoensis]|uniref:hypothetical protein n=1 Tax=Planococcus rifietoensis TaxID=200991 RepID=UPI00384D22D9
MSHLSLLNYISHDQINSDYWRELGISVDSIEDIAKNDSSLNSSLNLLLNRFKFQELVELASVYNIDLKKETLKENAITKFRILHSLDKKEILLLNEFINRKKKAVNIIYKLKGPKDKTFLFPLAQAKSLYLISPKLLPELSTYFQWNEKGSGTLHSLSKNISFNELFKLTTSYRKTFSDILYKKSHGNNRYKIHSYYALDKEELILNIYKQVNDSPRADFDKAIRNKEVSFILLKIDAKQSIVEIKGATKADEAIIVSYLEETFFVKASPVEPEVFKEYNSESVQKAFLTGEPVIENSITDFLVSKISLRTSLLKRSPKLSLELDNESIWPAVIHANERNILDVQSIKDIEHIIAQVQNKKRVIRSKLLPNGNIFFSFDDSRMSNEIKESFIEQFSNLFGIPLFQEISNYKFREGRMDKIDYYMSLSNTTVLSNDDMLLFDQLISDKLLIERQSLSLICKSCDGITEVENLDYDLEEYVCECGHEDCYTRKNTSVEPNIKTVASLVKRKLSPLFSSLKYSDKYKTSEVRINNEKHKFISYYNDETNEVIQLFITNDHIRPAFIKRLSTMMIPTLIITVGMMEETIQTLRDQGIFLINFGRIHLSSETDLNEHFNEIVKQIKLQSKTKISLAADHAYESLKHTLCEPSKVPEFYDDKIFEDDVFALLKDIVPNGEKWGKEKSGKAFPEGIFAISAKNSKKNDFRRVFSYDCKFTRDDKGYDLTRDETRKAFEYVKNLNENPYIEKYSDKEELTAHIFISNAFKETQKAKIRDYFYEYLDEDLNTKGIFLDVECLLYLHECYRNNVEYIHANRNLYYEKLILLFSKENITNAEIDKIFKDILDEDLSENKALNTIKVTNSYKEN